MKFDEYREALTALFNHVGYEGNPFDYYVIDASDYDWCVYWEREGSDTGEIMFSEPQDICEHSVICAGDNFFLGDEYALFIVHENLTDECMGTAYFFSRINQKDAES